jgi:hypothetical protein
MDWLKVDDWWEMIILGIIIIGALFILYLIIKLIITNGGIKTKGLNIGKNNLPCNEHTKTLQDINKTLLKMDSERSEASRLNQILFKNILTSQDALIEAFQKSNIGNGNLEKARKLISNSFDIKDDYLVNQL